LATVNPAAAFSVLTGGNIAADVLGGNAPSLKNLKQFGKYALGQVAQGLVAAAGGAALTRGFGALFELSATPTIIDGMKGFTLTLTKKTVGEQVAKSAVRSIADGALKSAAKKGSNALVTTGAQWSKHSLERLAQRGITQDMAEITINKGQKFYDPLNKSINYILSDGLASGKSLLVGTNPLTGEVTTVIRSSKNLIKPRMIPIQ
jgi:hypothetical protein